MRTYVDDYGIGRRGRAPRHRPRTRMITEIFSGTPVAEEKPDATQAGGLM
jgi:hypothetical protein